MLFEPVTVSVFTFCVIFLGETCVQVNSNDLVPFRLKSTPKQDKASSTNRSTANTRERSSVAFLPSCRSGRRSCSWYMDTDYIPDISITDYVWQPVGGASHKFFVYSAYCDSHEHCTSIRVIGATNRLQIEPVLCKVRYPNNVTLTSAGEVQIIKEHHRLMYAACFIKCPLAVHATPDSLSIVIRKQPSPTNPTNHLRVIDTKKYDNKSKRIGICVKPLHYTYNKTIQLVEFMELNRILGLDHVTFYNSSISRTTDCILRNYAAEGRATVLPWKDRFVSQKEIRTENLLAAQNDCLYRNKHNFSYLAFLDMDEFIMPAHNYSIRQLLQALDAKSRSHNIGSYNFCNAFFYLQWPNDTITNSSVDVYERTLTALSKTRRMLNVHKHTSRSKYIVKPTKVVTVGNHLVWEFAKGYERFNVAPKDGILNHYRICEFGGNDCISSISRVDRTVFRYKRRLVAAVKNRWQELQRKCGIGGIQQASELQ